jgi:GT2 family glycosyltransferase
VSVVIPARHNAEQLKTCLTSIKGNHYPPHLVEVIVVLNGSDAESLRVARDHGAIVVRGDGVAAELRNRGAMAALGGILIFIDSDQEIDHHWIETAVEILSRRNAVAVGAPYVPPSETSAPASPDGLRVRETTAEEAHWLASGHVAVTRDVFDRVRGFDRSLEASDDVDFCNRLHLAGHRIVADPALTSVHF